MRNPAPDPVRLLVLSPNWLGDAVMALPAIADLRRRWPAARLTVAARGSVAPAFELAGSVDAVVTLQWKGRWLDRTAFRADVAGLRQGRFDTTVVLPNSFASAWLVHRAGIQHRWGYARDGRSPLLTRAVPKPSVSLHQGAYYQHLVRELGAPSGPLEAMLTVTGPDLEAARVLLTARGWDTARRVIALAPGAAYGTAKRWLPEHFATLVSALVRERGFTCVLVGGPADAGATRLVREAVATEARRHVIDLVGATSLRALAGVLALADLCVSNDSGSMHLAAALGVRVVALFGPTREKETAPLSRAATPATVLVHEVWCRPCMLRECPIDHRCMTGLLPARVLTAVTEALPEATA
jgi:heptosyltransferase-2